MALFGGGSAQATNHNQANILFNPQVNVGDGSTDSTPTFNPISTTSPKLDDSLKASVGVGVGGGSGSGGPLQNKEESPFSIDDTPSATATSKINIDKYLPFLGIAAAIVLFNSLNKKKTPQTVNLQTPKRLKAS